MNMMFGRWPFGRFIYNGRAGMISGAVINYPLQESGFAAKIYDQAGQKLAEYGDTIQNNILTEIEFELDENGCAALTLVFSKKPAIDILYNYRVDIHLFGDPDPWYSGYITRIPLPGTTEQQFTYEGYGFYKQLDNTLVDATYQNTEISAIVKTIMTSYVVPDTDIVYKSSKIVAVGYTVNGIAFEDATAKEALEQLAEYAGNYVVGVDERRELFFKPVSTAIAEDSRFWVGWDAHSFKPEETLDDVKNYLIVKGSVLQVDGTYVLYSNYDADSITDYGLRKAVLTLPSALTTADAQRWGDNQLDKLKTPPQAAEVENIKVKQRLIKAYGKARVTSWDGKHVYDLPITRVIYRVSAEDGISCGLSLGPASTQSLDEFIAKLVRDIKNAEAVQSLINKNLSS
ncbi:hypothetical protein [Anaeroselena agilis]|uniref:Uncharacterized protein n=1 Tax=Anaeroselena agilis TaxID=3063788 RepID=A0ABU3NY38_9FIRM|nr:hypothetical protein [Selenomonadales bacterium 4137-cl]